MIESRVLLSGYSPTDVEQYYLELLDDARFNPAAYGQSLGLNLSNVAPAQPLAMNEELVESARLHSQDMINQDYFSHTSPQGTDPGDRIAAAGFSYTGWAESIETNTNPAPSSQGFPANYGAWDAGYSLGNLIVDQGVPDLGHRIMLLDIGGLDHAMQQIGIGIASQDSTSGGFAYRQTDTTIDLASTSDSNPFLTGVVFNDTAGNGEYQPGEGLSGVTIAVSGVGSTTTLDAGGYSIELAPGTYTVTASGGALPAPIARTVIIGNDNVRLNFDEDPNGATLAASSSGAVSGQLGTFTAIAAGDTPSSYSARIDWGDGNDSFATLTANPDGSFSVQGSNSYASPGVYAVRVLITHLSDGQTVALNATADVGSGGSGGSNPTSPNPTPTGPGSTTSGGSGQESSSPGTNGSPGPTSPGTGTTTGSGQGSHHKKKHHKPAPHPRPTLHPRGKSLHHARPLQSDRKPRG
jgi:Cysteine-rich secretory protein family